MVVRYVWSAIFVLLGLGFLTYAICGIAGAVKRLSEAWFLIAIFASLAFALIGVFCFAHARKELKQDAE